VRKCIRCGADMVEDVAVRNEGYAYGLNVTTDSKWFPRRISKVKAAVCPECGEVSLFIDPKEMEK